MTREGGLWRGGDQAVSRSTIVRQVRASGVSADDSAAPQTTAPGCADAFAQTGATSKRRPMPETSTSNVSGRGIAADISSQGRRS